MGRARRANPRRTQRFPLPAGAQHKENSIQYLPVRHPTPVTAQGMRLGHMDREMGGQPLPERIRNAEFLNRSHTPKIQLIFSYSDRLLMNRENVKRYWLDFKHKSTTLWAFTDVRLGPGNGGSGAFICGTRYIPMPEHSPPSAFATYSNELMAGVKHPASLNALIPTPWLAPICLLITIAALGTWRIRRSGHQLQSA